MKKNILLLFFCLFTELYSQSCSTLNIQSEYDLPDTCAHENMTMQHDKNNRPYLYVAAKAGGLKIYNLSNTALVETVPVSLLNNHHVMNVHQDGNYLYLALGDHFNVFSQGGMAIINITDPTNAVVEDVWDSTWVGGAGIVKTEGNYAYLGAMFNGLVILNVTNKNNITYVSRLIPNTQYPNFVAWPGTLKYNVRGMQVKNDIVYTAYDAGGFRIINCENKFYPVETGRYCNALFTNQARAYNNVVLNDTLAYVTVDYCGLEILNIKDTSHITLLGWWNPWTCPTVDSAVWNASPGHTNEIEYNSNCELVFISSGKGDMHVVDVSDPTMPDSCNYYGGGGNGIGTWGISAYQDTIFLSYICTNEPFTSNYTGIKVLSHNSCQTSNENIQSNLGVKFYPNPSTELIQLVPVSENFEVRIFDISGKEIFYGVNQKTIFTSDLSDGLYILRYIDKNGTISNKFIHKK